MIVGSHSPPKKILRFKRVADAKVKAGIDKAAAELMKTKGASLVVCGSNDMNIQVVVNTINEIIGANGTTINWAVTNNTRKGTDTEMSTP